MTQSQEYNTVAFGFGLEFFPLKLLFGATGKGQQPLWGGDRQLYGSVWRASLSLRLENLLLHSCTLSLSLCAMRCDPIKWSCLALLWAGTRTMWLARHNWWMTETSWNFTDAPTACGYFSYIFTLLTFPLKNEMGVATRNGALDLFRYFFYFGWSALYSCDCLFSN